jgi:DNA-binding NarL/FixJ family response regulator
MDKIKVAMVDDHKIVRDGIRAMFLADPGIEIVAETGDAVSMLEKLRYVQPHILIIDINLPDMDGNILAMQVNERFPGISILMLSAAGDEATVLMAVKAGVKGYLTKECSADEFLEAINSIADGDEYFGDKISRIIFRSYKKMLNSADTTEQSAAKGLSQRETEVLKGFADGLSYKEIGEKLFISPRTVETHKASIMEKLELKSVADLVKYALKNGLVKLN